MALVKASLGTSDGVHLERRALDVLEVKRLRLHAGYNRSWAIRLPGCLELLLPLRAREADPVLVSHPILMIVKIQRRETPFALVNKAILEDTRLSWKAKGMMAYLLSRPESWKVISEDITNRSTDGRESVLAGMNELREFGYAHLKQDRDDKGQVSGKYWVVYEEPTPPCRDTISPKTGKTDSRENQPTGFPIVGKPATSNKDSTKKELQTHKARGTLKELREFAKEIGLTEDDGEACFDKWEGNGWKNDGKVIICWRSTMRAWKKFGYMASQKSNGFNGRRYGSKLASEPAALPKPPSREDYLNGGLQ